MPGVTEIPCRGQWLTVEVGEVTKPIPVRKQSGVKHKVASKQVWCGLTQAMGRTPIVHTLSVGKVGGDETTGN